MIMITHECMASLYPLRAWKIQRYENCMAIIIVGCVQDVGASLTAAWYSIGSNSVDHIQMGIVL